MGRVNVNVAPLRGCDDKHDVYEFVLYKDGVPGCETLARSYIIYGVSGLAGKHLPHCIVKIRIASSKLLCKFFKKAPSYKILVAIHKVVCLCVKRCQILRADLIDVAVTAEKIQGRYRCANKADIFACFPVYYGLYDCYSVFPIHSSKAISKDRLFGCMCLLDVISI